MPLEFSENLPMTVNDNFNRMGKANPKDILRFQDSSEEINRMPIDEDVDLENQDPSSNTATKELVENGSFHRLVAPEDMLVVGKEDGVGEEVIASHCSYEEVVHKDEEMSEEILGEKRILLILTQWTLTLQEVYKERVNSEILKNCTPGSKCVCGKTASLEKELKRLQIRLSSRRSRLQISHPRTPEESFDDIVDDNELNRVQALLKSNVSIQISRPNTESILESRRLIHDMEDPEQYLCGVIHSLVCIVKDLLPCGSGRHFDSTEGPLFPSSEENDGTSGVMEQEEEEDMSLRVASMSTSPSKSSRKRKQVLKNKSPPASPISLSPSKKPRKVRSASFGGVGESSVEASSSFRIRPFYKANNVIDILEKNKKMAKTNGLYQFVLWREALKAEKDRVGTAPNGKNYNKRLSFDL